MMFAMYSYHHQIHHHYPLLRLSGFAMGFAVGVAVAHGGVSRFKSCAPLRLDPTPPKLPQPSQPSVAASIFAGLVAAPPRLESASGCVEGGGVRPAVKGHRRESAGPCGRGLHWPQAAASPRPPLPCPRVRPPLALVRALPTGATGASVPFAISAGRLGWTGRLR